MIRFIISAVFMLLGIFVIFSAMVGNFRFGYVLNRMQVGATADTLGAFFIISSLIVAGGFNATSIKLAGYSNENLAREMDILRSSSG